MTEPVLIGNAQGFWGDSTNVASTLLKQVPELDYITLDYLAEVSLSIMAIQKDKDANLGYARDFIPVVESLIPHWKDGSKVKIVCNAGGLNPEGCAKACIDVLQKHGCSEVKVAVVSGDDVLPKILENPGSHEFQNAEDGKSLEPLKERIITANAYIGADEVVEALQQGADIVITGRVADPSLVVGPCIFHHGWSEDEYDKIAGATIAGHLIECGRQVSGGFSTHWLDIKDPANIGFPYVEVSETGSCVVKKGKGTGGEVTERTVKEQLLYEIGDPENYLSPDATVSFLSLHVEDLGSDQVSVSGARGKAPPKTYKVSATYRDGFRSEGMLTFRGDRAHEKARRCSEVIIERVKQAGFSLEKTHCECLGTGDVAPGVPFSSENTQEVVMRLVVADSNKAAIECFTKEVAPLITSGPQGVTGYTSGRPKVRPIFSYWPCTIEREKVQVNVKLIEAVKL